MSLFWFVLQVNEIVNLDICRLNCLELVLCCLLVLVCLLLACLCLKLECLKKVCNCVGEGCLLLVFGFGSFVAVRYALMEV